MQLNQTLIPEWQHEGASTRKMLERVSTESLAYLPHAKSMSMTRLASHIADLAGWMEMTLTTPELNFANFNYKPAQAETTEQLVQIFDEHFAKSLAALQNATNEQLMEPWTLRNGDHIIMTMPRIAVIRSMVMNHMIHHRGQLSVYLRLNDIPLPGMYGPSKDEQEAVAAAQN